MKGLKKLQKVLLLALMVSFVFSQNLHAEDAPSYTYMVTLSTGNQGTFANTSGISVVSASGSTAWTVSAPEANGTLVRVTGLKYGDRIVLDAMSGMVTLNDSVKYYVRGVRESGDDNSAIGSASFLVESDRDYVVGYAMKGNMVSYTVNYQNEAGQSLAESRTYYGVVGDKPVVAFRYIEGYLPQAYNLTKTLSANEADNVFNFVYRVAPAGTTTVVTTETVTTQAGTTQAGTTQAGTTQAGTTQAGTTQAGTTQAGTTQAGTTQNDANATVDNGTANDNEEEQNAEPEEIRNLDEEQVPLADGQQSQGQQASSGRPKGTMIAFGAIGACSLLALIILIVLLKRKKLN